MSKRLDCAKDCLIEGRAGSVTSSGLESPWWWSDAKYIILGKNEYISD